MSKKENPLITIIAGGFLLVVTFTVLMFVWNGLNAQQTLYNRERKQAREYIHQNNFKKAKVLDVVATQHTTSSTKSSGILLPGYMSKSKSDSYKRYKISKIKYLLNGKERTLDLTNDTVGTLTVLSKGEVSFSKKGTEPSLTSSAYIDSDTSKAYGHFVVRTKLHLMVPKDYNFSQAFELGDDDR